MLKISKKAALFLALLVHFAVHAQNKNCSFEVKTSTILDESSNPIGLQANVFPLELAESSENIVWIAENEIIGTESSIKVYKNGTYRVQMKSKTCGLTESKFNAEIPKKKTAPTKISEPVTPGCDSNEPNNLPTNAKLIIGTSFTQNGVCFETSSDVDWYRFYYNGRSFYFKIFEFLGYTGYYSVNLSLSGSNCTISTSSYNGSNIDTYIEMYDSDGTSLLDYDDDDGSAYFSSLTFSVTTPTISLSTLESSNICNGGVAFVGVSRLTGIMASGNVFAIYLSDSNGSFDSPTLLSTQYYSSWSRYMVQLPSGLIPSNNYKLRAVYKPLVSIYADVSISVGSSAYNATLSSGGQTSKCPSDLITLTSSTSANSNYTWINDGSRAFSNSNINKTIYTGEFRVLLYHSSGCSTITPAVTISNYSVNNPYLTINPSNPVLGQTISGSVSSCGNGTTYVKWAYLDKSESGVFNTSLFTQTPNKPIGYEVYCVSNDHSCKSEVNYKSLFFGLACDPTESNETIATASPISGYSHESYHCFNSSTDMDFFKIQANNTVFYLKVSLYSTLSSLGNYNLSVTSTPQTISFETKPLYGSSIDTKVYLYDANGILLGSDDDSGIGTFSYLTYSTNLFGCQSNVSITQNSVNGVEKYSATNQIQASNKLQNTSRSSYTSAKSIILQPNFTVEPGAVFTAEIAGCQ